MNFPPKILRAFREKRAFQNFDTSAQNCDFIRTHGLFFGARHAAQFVHFIRADRAKHPKKAGAETPASQGRKRPEGQRTRLAANENDV